MVMFCTFLSLPDHFTAIKQPEGIKKELTQSSLICAKGKASSFTHSFTSFIHSFIHSRELSGTASQSCRSCPTKPETLPGEEIDSRCPSMTRTRGQNARLKFRIFIYLWLTGQVSVTFSLPRLKPITLKTSVKKPNILTILLFTFSHQAKTFLNKCLSACQET